jgi:large subunit ribosomal protein L9
VKVILLKDVKGQGKKDDVIDVSDGYGNNFLIKNGLGVLYSKKSKEILDNELTQKKEQEEALVESFLDVKKKLEGQIIEFKVKTGEQDKVFGTVSSKQISDKLQTMGYKIDKKCIKINVPIQSLGITKVNVELHKRVKLELNIKLVK